MDINDLRGISTAFLLFAFIALVVWAYSSKQKKEFDEAANLPFADDDLPQDGKQEGTK
ncbi:MAG: cbb3-type cytochrome c oxidase subunit 3 [Congregibacter sp.]|nr:cbb3-type cytochrome c oxidase subunit 3 [Congregibacter sp.]